MNTRIAFKNMEHNPHIEEFAHNELAKLNKFLQPTDKTIYIDLVMDMEGVDHRQHGVELRVQDKHGLLVSHDLGRDIYACISQVVSKMLEELAKAKGERLDQRDKPQHDALRKDKLDFEK